MGTNNTPRMTSSNKRDEKRKAKKVEELANDERVQRLLGYYGLSLTEPMATPLFGPLPLQLDVYNDQRDLTSMVVAPSLDYLSQDLGLVDRGAYEAIKALELPAFFRGRLFDDTLKRGKDELNRYLRNLRPLLMEQQIYLYCTTPVSFYKTDIGSSDIVVKKGKRPLIALPMSVTAARLRGCSDEEIKELAPSVAWLIPILVGYGHVKETEDLIARLDGWLTTLTRQQNEQLYTAFIKHVPSLVSKEVSQLLLPR